MMQNTRILIVEDEVLIAEDIKDALLSFGVQQVELAHAKLDALTLISAFKPNLVLLDIRMEGNTDGLEIADELKKEGNIPFVFITSHSDVEMIKEIIKTNPAGYITKPFKKSDLFASVNLALNSILTKTTTIKIKDGNEYHMVNVSDILYIKSDGNYVELYLENKRRLTSRTKLESVQQELNNSNFIKVGKSYIVNAAKVESYNSKELVITGTTIPISRNYFESFEEQLNKEK